MSYNPITENLSFDYQPDPITSNVTLTDWHRKFYDVFATNSDIYIILPDDPSPFNNNERGSLFFRRIDGNSNRNVTVQAVINGTLTVVPIPVEADIVHWFISVYDGRTSSNTFYFQLSSAEAINQTRVTRLPATTLSPSNIDILFTSYIGANIGGWILAAGDTVLVGSQTNSKENAVYVVQNNGGLVRRRDFEIGRNIDSYIVPVIAGEYATDIYLFYNKQRGQGFPAIAGYDNINCAVYLNNENPLLLNGYEKIRSVVDQNYVASSDDYVITMNLTAGVNRTLTLPKLSSLLTPSTTGMMKIYRIFKLAPSGILSIACTAGDTFGDGSTSTSLQKNGDNIYLSGIISSNNSYWLIG